MQYDMDARPFYEKFVITISEDKIIINEKLLNWANNTLKKCKNYQNLVKLKLALSQQVTNLLKMKKYLRVFQMRFQIY